jgi:hypothetical protein
MFVDVETLVRLAVHIGGDVVSLLWRETAGIGLGHIVLNERSHFPDFVHASAVTIGIRPPKGGDRGWLSCAVGAVTQRALLRVHLAAAVNVA